MDRERGHSNQTMSQRMDEGFPVRGQTFFGRSLSENYANLGKAKASCVLWEGPQRGVRRKAKPCRVTWEAAEGLSLKERCARTCALFCYESVKYKVIINHLKGKDQNIE